MMLHTQQFRKLTKAVVLFCVGIMTFSSAAGMTATAEDTTEAVASDANGDTGVADETTKDFVLVLDESGTMEGADPDNMCDSAAKMFIDMLPAENARLSIVAFGIDYGSEAAALPENYNGNGKNKVKVVFPLTDITEQSAKDQAKQAIAASREAAKNANKNNTESPVAYALAAANQLLDDGGSADDNAAIILMSDGRISGQTSDDQYDGGLNYHTVDEQANISKDHSRPIYCIELNMDGENDGNSYAGKVGRNAMRAVIPGITGTEAITLDDASKASEAYAQIFTRFFQAEETGISDSQTIQDGIATFNFEIKEMVAETNVTLTGNIADFESVDIINADGGTETFNKADGNVTHENGDSAIFDEKYMIMKLVTPKEGNCQIVVHGTNDVQVGLYAVSIREMNLMLSSDQNSSAEVARNTTVTFNGEYFYKGHPYDSEKVYTNYPAKLIIYQGNDKDHPDEIIDTIDMKGEGTKYTAQYTFAEKGIFNAYIHVESDTFRDKYKDSGIMTFAVESKPTIAVGKIEDIELRLRQSYDQPLNAADYFDAQDGDPLTFDMAYTGPDHELGAQIDENGAISIRAGEKSGVYNFTVTAGADGETPVKQTFTVTVRNSPLELKGDYKNHRDCTVNLVINGDKVPGVLRAIGDVPKETDVTYAFADMFTDPDGDTPIVSVEDSADYDSQNNDIAPMNLDEKRGTVTFSAVKTGKAGYTILAKDANEENNKELWQRIYITIVVQDAAAFVWDSVKVPVIGGGLAILAVLAALIAVFGGRKLYGVWDVTTSNGYENDCKLASYRSGRKAKCSLNALLNDIGVGGDFGRVEIAAGNNINKLVILKNLSGLSSVEYNGNEVDPTKVKNLAIRKGQSVTLESDSDTVTLERH